MLACAATSAIGCGDGTHPIDFVAVGHRSLEPNQEQVTCSSRNTQVTVRTDVDPRADTFYEIRAKRLGGWERVSSGFTFPGDDSTASPFIDLRQANLNWPELKIAVFDVNGSIVSHELTLRGLPTHGFTGEPEIHEGSVPLKIQRSDAEEGPISKIAIGVLSEIVAAPLVAFIFGRLVTVHKARAGVHKALRKRKKR